MTPLELPAPVVDASWLAAHLDKPNLVILDASWYMPAAQRSGLNEWRQQRITRARFFDFDQEIADHDSALPHMLPSVEQFSQQVAALGISNQDTIVIYDGSGIFSAPRAWWMFKAMGHERVAVLDGGLPNWLALALPVDNTPPQAVAAGQFKAVLQRHWLVDAAQVQAALTQPNYRVLDARSYERFSGQAPDPRSGVRAGHMPGAVCLPFAELLHQGKYLPNAQLVEKLAPLLTPEQTLICSCGSGVTAAIIALAAYVIGHQQVAVYDGSWTEWGGSADLPVVTE